MLCVELLDLSFYAFHGVYPGEAKIGNDYLVNVWVTYNEELVDLTDLSSVINYEQVYDIVKRRMAIPSPLLEEVAHTIIMKVRHQYPMISEMKISIYKLNPPIENFQGRVGVTITRKFAR
jgi:dihydroneopterin aldolase